MRFCITFNQTRFSFISKLFSNSVKYPSGVCSLSLHLPCRFSQMETKSPTNMKLEEPFRRLETPVKGLCDRYEYSVIQLKNGLTALLISDVDHLITLNDNAEESLSKGAQSDLEESGSDSESSGSDSEMEVDEEEGGKKSTDEKLAALSLSVGVGSFCDGNIPGLAHFLEHMVFMGSEKYPEENDFDAFLSTRGGSSNASTEYEYTTFYFDVPEPHLKSSMDIFSNFFISPLLRQDSIQNEMEIVDSEFQSSILNDTCRLEQLLATTCTAGNPAGKFVWGNLDTLGKAGVGEAELYTALQAFRRRYYVADRMTLALQARLDLATLESWVVEHFAGIPSSGPEDGEAALHSGPGPRPTPRFQVEAPFQLDKWSRFYTVKPVEDVNILHLTWVTPPVQDLYHIKPLDTLSWFIGHEGKGSIMAYLRQRHLATEMEAGYQDSGFDYNHIYTLFQINITLTELGLSQIKHIIDIVFQYLTLLNQISISEEMYKEVAQIHKIGFDYSSIKSSADYTEQLSQNMLYYPSHDYLTGPALFTDHSPSTIQSMLDCFTPARMNIALLSSIASQRTEGVGVTSGAVASTRTEEVGVKLDQVEKWFGTEYRVDEIDEAWLRDWDNVTTIDPALFLPARNPFVTTSFDLYPIGNGSTESSKYPEALLKTDQMEVWFKQTTKYKLPKANVYFVFELPHTTESARASVLFDMYVCALNVVLQEETYDAYLAQYLVSVCRGDYGLHVSCNGFSQHMHRFLQIVLTQMRSVTVSRDLFNVCRETLLRQYLNNTKDMGLLRRCLRMCILLRSSFMVGEKYRVLRDDVTFDELTNFQTTLFDRMFVKCLVMGNVTRESALSLSALCTSSLPFTPLDPSERREHRVTQLESGEKIVRVKSFNEKDPNCTVMNYYQSRENSGSLRESCVIELLVEIIAEPLFDTLRTKMKLGYHVSATVRDTFGVLGMSVEVDSQVHKHSVTDIQSKVHGFVSRYVRDNETRIRAKYEAIVETVVKKKNMVEVNLKEESSRHFEEIKLNEYQFDRQEKEISLIKQIPLSEVMEWVDHNIVDQGMKLLSIQVVGDGDGTKEVAGKESAKAVTDHKRKLSVETGEDHRGQHKLPVRIEASETSQVSIVGNANPVGKATSDAVNGDQDMGDEQNGINPVDASVGDTSGNQQINGVEKDPNIVSKDPNIVSKDPKMVSKESQNLATRHTRLPESPSSRESLEIGSDRDARIVLEYLIPNDETSERFIRDIRAYRDSLDEYPVIKLK